MTESIAIACDHGGVDLKGILKADLLTAGYEVLDFGTDSTDSVDYPDFGYKMADAINSNDVERGVLICGSGIGISMAANRCPAVRAATVHDVTSARLSREHNDANIICFGARLIGREVARECLKIFLDTRFKAGQHIRRVEKLSNPSA